MAQVGSRISNSIKGAASKRILIVFGIVAVVSVGIYMASQPAPVVSPSEVRSVPGSGQTVQGRDALSPAMTQELESANQQRRDQALTSGGSAFPTIVRNDTEDRNLAQLEPDPAPVVPQRPSPPVVSRPAIQPAATPLVAPVRVAQAAAPAQEEVMNLAKVMADMPTQTFQAAGVQYFDIVRPEVSVSPQAAAPGAGGQPSAASPIKLPLAGTIIYAEMISEANSDSPGPVLAQIVQGDLAGAKLIGQFATQRDTLVISFNTLTMSTDRNGNVIDATVPIQAFAVDAGTIGTGIASTVDYHLLQNLGVTFASAFVQGLGEAVAKSGQSVTYGDRTTTITNPALTTEQQLLIASGTAAGAAGETLNELFGNRPVTVKVKSGTGVGILFLGSN